MIAEQRNRLWLNGAWFVGILLFSGGLVAGAMAQLSSREAQIEKLEQSIEDKERALDTQADPESEAQGMTRVQAILAASREMVESESQRIVALSHAAEFAGITIVKLNSLESGPDDGALPKQHSHTLEVRGDYRRIAEFLSALYEADGTLGVDELLIEPEDGDENARLSGHLRAALRVTWYANEVREPDPTPNEEIL